MRAVFNKVSLSLMLVFGLLDSLVIDAGRLNLRLFLIGAVASLAGSAIGAGIFAMFNRKRDLGSADGFYSAIVSLISAVIACWLFGWVLNAYWESHKTGTSDLPVALGVLVLVGLAIAPALIISAFVMGAGAARGKTMKRS